VIRPGEARFTREEKPPMDDTFPDLGSLTDLQLKDVVRQLAEEETAIPYPSLGGRSPTP
jgi:hypothetical protein